MAGLPNTDDAWAEQHWPQPTTLPEAKKMFGKLRSGKTRLARHADSFPAANINKIIMLAHITWNEMDHKCWMM